VRFLDHNGESNLLLMIRRAYLFMVVVYLDPVVTVLVRRSTKGRLSKGLQE
jgi:hypothetical protein